MLKNKEELIKQNIQEVINSWDPIGLMNICPEDEYEPEINKIVEFVICNKNMGHKPHFLFGCIINGVDRRNFYQCHFLIKKVETIKFSC